MSTRPIETADAVREAEKLLGTPYGSGPGEIDCINLIKKVIRDAPGGVKDYTTAHTNALWESYYASPKYRDITWRQQGTLGARTGMLAFKMRTREDGTLDVHHVGLIVPGGQVIHASSAEKNGRQVVRTRLDDSWQAIARHRYIAADGDVRQEDEEAETLYRARVMTEKDPLRVRAFPKTGEILGHIPRGALVDVLEECADGWARVRYGELAGYAAKAFLLPVEAAEEADGQTDSPGQENGQQEGSTRRTVIENVDTLARIVLDGRWRVLED